MKDLKHLYYFEKLLEEANNELVRSSDEFNESDDLRKSRKPRAAEKPLFVEKSRTITGIHENSYDRLNDAYKKLSTDFDVSDKGRDLDFETKYDEQRFFKMLERINKRIKECSVNYIKIHEDYEMLCGNEMEEELKKLAVHLEDLEEEKRLRSDKIHVDDKYRELGCVNVWEEKIFKDYETLKERYDKGESCDKDSDKAVLFRYQRLEEAIQIRQDGDTGMPHMRKEDDRNSELGVLLLDGTFETRVPDYAV